MRETIIQAIQDRRRLRLIYKGQTRIVEPYLLFQNQSGTEILHSWQTDGEWEKSQPPDWCNLTLSKVTRVTALDENYDEPHRDYNPDSPLFHRVIVATPKKSSGHAARG